VGNQTPVQAFIEYAEKVFASERARFEWLEEKAMRVFTVLAFAVGSANIVLLDPLTQVLQKTQWLPSMRIFIGLAALTTVSAIATGVLTALSLRPRIVPTFPFEGVEDAFIGPTSDLDATRVDLARELLSATATTSSVNGKRASLIQVAFLLLLVTLAGVLATSAVYLFVARLL